MHSAPTAETPSAVDRGNQIIPPAAPHLRAERVDSLCQAATVGRDFTGVGGGVRWLKRGMRSEHFSERARTSARGLTRSPTQTRTKSNF